MANVKYRWLIVTLSAIYAVWIPISAYVDSVSKFSTAIVASKLEAVKHAENDAVAALIVGGSNATYSLSAQRLTELSNERWFNAALPREGASFENMTDYLDAVATNIERERITTIVVSTIEHIRDALVSRTVQRSYFTRSGVGFDGVRPGPAWLPQGSLLKRILNPRPPKVNLVTEFGDLDFDRDSYCRPSDSPKPVRTKPVMWASDEQINLVIDNWIPYLHHKFPNASIVFTVPAQYFPSPPDQSSREIYLARLDDAISRWRDRHRSFDIVEVATIMEQPVTDGKLVCNSPHHFNGKGRELRSVNLWGQLNLQ